MLDFFRYGQLIRVIEDPCSSVSQVLIAFRSLCKSLKERDLLDWARNELEGYDIADNTVPECRKLSSIIVSSSRDSITNFSCPIIEQSRHPCRWDSTAMVRYLPEINGLVVCVSPLRISCREGISYYERQLSSSTGKAILFDKPDVRVSTDKSHGSYFEYYNIVIECPIFEIENMLSATRKSAMVNLEELKRCHFLLRKGAMMAKMIKLLMLLATLLLGGSLAFHFVCRPSTIVVHGDGNKINTGDVNGSNLN